MSREQFEKETGWSEEKGLYPSGEKYRDNSVGTGRDDFFEEYNSAFSYWKKLSMQEEIQRLREYTQHKPDCKGNNPDATGIDFDATKCTCGLSELLEDKSK